MDVISDLWNGKVAPCECCGAKDAKTNLLFGKIRQGKEKLVLVLPDEQRDLLEQYGQCWEDYLLRMMELSFREGMILGTRLGAEVFSVNE